MQQLFSSFNDWFYIMHPQENTTDTVYKSVIQH